MVYQKDGTGFLSVSESGRGVDLTPMVVCGNSMKPFFRAGQMVAVRETAPEEIGKGSVVLFPAGDGKTRVMHRVFDIVDENGCRRFFCRGDNNSRPDGCIGPDQVIGKVIGRYSRGKLKPFRRYHEFGGLILAGWYRRFKSLGKKLVVTAWPLLSRWFSRTLTVQDQRGRERDLVFMGWGNLRLRYNFMRVAARAASPSGLTRGARDKRHNSTE